MAIGDAFAVILGTATTNRQPAAGVEEQISCICKPDQTDYISVYDGSNEVKIIAPGTSTYDGNVDSAFNMALMITNSVYFRKSGTTNRVYIGGVQTNV